MENCTPDRELFPTNFLSCADLSATLPMAELRHHPTQFRLFPKLPPELRLEIWKFALPCGQNGKMLIPVQLDTSQKAWCPGAEVEWNGNWVYSFKVIKEAVSAMSHDFRDVGVSAANHESRAVYLKNFSKHNKIKNGIIRYPPGTIIHVEHLSELIRPHWNENLLRPHYSWDPTELSLSLQDVFEAWRFFGKVEHMSCSVVDMYIMTRLHVSVQRFRLPSGPLYQLTQMDVKSLSILGRRHGWDWVRLGPETFDQDSFDDEAKEHVVEALLTAVREGFGNVHKKSKGEFIVPEVNAVVESCLDPLKPCQLTQVEILKRLDKWNRDLRKG